MRNEILEPNKLHLLRVIIQSELNLRIATVGHKIKTTSAFPKLYVQSKVAARIEFLRRQL